MKQAMHASMALCILPPCARVQAAALRNGLHQCLVRMVGEDRAAATPVILGGDLNSLWRKYGDDYFDKVRVPGLEFEMYHRWGPGRCTRRLTLVCSTMLSLYSCRVI